MLSILDHPFHYTTKRQFVSKQHFKERSYKKSCQCVNSGSMDTKRLNISLDIQLGIFLYVLYLWNLLISMLFIYVLEMREQAHKFWVRERAMVSTLPGFNLSMLSLVPRPCLAFRCLQCGKAGGPGYLFLRDIRIERMVERVYLCMGTLGPEQQKEPRCQPAHHIYLASRGRLSYTPSIEPVVGWTIHNAVLHRFSKVGGFWKNQLRTQKQRLSEMWTSRWCNVES